MATPETFPPRASILLPSRAFLLSVREQTLPARLAAIEESLRISTRPTLQTTWAGATWRCSG